MAIIYVHNSNVGEIVGTETKKETEEVIRKLTEGSLSQGDKDVEKSVKETVNTYKAMEEFHKMHKAMELKHWIFDSPRHM